MGYSTEQRGFGSLFFLLLEYISGLIETKHPPQEPVIPKSDVR